jgi:hypothetical protein
VAHGYLGSVCGGRGGTKQQQQQKQVSSSEEWVTKTMEVGIGTVQIWREGVFYLGCMLH